MSSLPSSRLLPYGNCRSRTARQSAAAIILQLLTSGKTAKAIGRISWFVLRSGRELAPQLGEETNEPEEEQ
jgi:hypothetical protein